LVLVYGVLIVIVPGFMVTWRFWVRFWVSEQTEPALAGGQTAGAATVTETADDVEDAYELLVGLNTAVMLLPPWGRELVSQVAVPLYGEVVLTVVT
jgi:hypothetical protein